MQIKFEATKLKEAKEYVNLLQAPKAKEIKKKEKDSIIKKIFKLLFK